MSKQDFIKTNGKVTEALGGDRFRVELENGAAILGTLSGKMRQRHIRICEVIAYGAMAYLAITAYVRLRHVGSKLDELQATTAKLCALVSAVKLQSDFDHINDMKDTLRQLVEAEQFEDAAKLQAVIAEQEELALKNMKAIQDSYGCKGLAVCIERK